MSTTSHITPSQQISIDRIKAFMMARNADKPLCKFVVNAEKDFVEVVAKDVDNFWYNTEAQFFIYKRGRISVRHVFTFVDAEQTKKHFQYILS